MLAVTYYTSTAMVGSTSETVWIETLQVTGADLDAALDRYIELLTVERSAFPWWVLLVAVPLLTDKREPTA